MPLTKAERAMLANQNRILAVLDANNSEDYLLKAEIAENGYEGLYEKLFDNLSEGISEEVCEETHNILTMYRVINNFIATLTPEQQQTLNLGRIEFEGFDANNDKHYFFMKFIVEKADMYDEYQNENLNSHSIASLRKYKRMLPVYNQALEANNYQLNMEGLEAILAAI